MYSLYMVQKQILTTLQTRLSAPPPEPVKAGSEEEAEAIAGDAFTAFPPAPARARKRKSVLLIDDDEAALQAAVQALEKAEVPVRAMKDYSAALAAITEDKPDVIALEPKMGGDQTGEDLINAIKATMEWVDIPVVLYTSAEIENKEQARTQYGADEFVLKGPRGPAALVSQVITLFRKPR
jgi:CheY-like chemotaxis protein